MEKLIYKLVALTLGTVVSGCVKQNVSDNPSEKIEKKDLTPSEVPCVYGPPPSLEMTFNGTVLDAIHGKPVKGIQVLVGSNSTFTDDDGKWSLTAYDDSSLVEFHDVDGPTNGSFASHKSTLTDQMVVELEPGKQ